MKKILALASLSTLIAAPALAEGFFLGGEVSVVSYPRWVDKMNNAAIAAGYTTSESTQKSGSVGLGIRGGQWVNDSLGWEMGYDNLGSTTGYTNTTGSVASAEWKYSAAALHAAALGGIKLGSGTLFGKLGVHGTSTNLEGTYLGKSGSYSHSASGMGLLIGGGYTFPFSPNLSGRADLSLFNDVKFVNLTNFANTTSENLFKISFGVDYTF